MITLNVATKNSLIKMGKVTIAKGSRPGTLKFGHVLLGLKEYQVDGIEWQQQGSRNAGKAAVGFVLFGVLGAALGGRKKDTSVAVIKMRDVTGVKPLYVQCSAKEFEKLNKLL